MLLDSIKAGIGESLKKGDHIRVDTLRFLLSDIRNMAIAKYGAAGEASVTDQDVLDVVKKQVKSHKESSSMFKDAGRTDLFDREQAQLAILESYLPAQISDEELKLILTDVMSSGENNFGKLMGLAMSRVKGQADGNRVSVMLKSLLEQ
jgi:uncharacterized protein